MDSTKYYVLSPLVRLRKETHRCLFYTIDDFFHSTDNLSILHPNDVIFLLLFDGTRTLSDVKKDFEYLFNINNFNIEQYLTNLKKVLHDFDFLVEKETLTEKEIEEVQNRYNPEDFIIDQDQIFLDARNLRIEAPLSVNFNVSSKCGFKCLYCYHPLHNIKEYISLDRLREIFKEFKELGIESVLLSGGDPMLRPDIDDIMQALYEAGVFYTLSTKSIISKARIQKLYTQAGLDRIQLSLDSFNPKIEAKLLGVNIDYVEKFLQMLKDMQEIGMAVRLKAVLTSYNAWEIKDYLEKAVQYNIKHIQVVSYGRSGYRHTDDLFPTIEQMNFASNAIEEFRKNNPDIEVVGGGFSPSYDKHSYTECNSTSEMLKDRVICNAGRFALLLMQNGELFVCEHLPYSKDFVIGDLREDSLKEAWKGERMQKWLSPPDRSIFKDDSPCKTCPDEVYEPCHKIYSRCLRFCREYTGDVNTPDRKCPYSEYNEIRLT